MLLLTQLGLACYAYSVFLSMQLRTTPRMRAAGSACSRGACPGAIGKATARKCANKAAAALHARCLSNGPGGLLSAGHARLWRSCRSLSVNKSQAAEAAGGIDFMRMRGGWLCMSEALGDVNCPSFRVTAESQNPRKTDYSAVHAVQSVVGLGTQCRGHLCVVLHLGPRP